MRNAVRKMFSTPSDRYSIIFIQIPIPCYMQKIISPQSVFSIITVLPRVLTLIVVIIKVKWSEMQIDVTIK